MGENAGHKNLTPFLPGNPGGPGRPPTSPELKAIREITRDDLIDIGMMVVKGDTEALENVIKNAKNPDPLLRPTALQVLTASCLHKAILKGDVNVLNSLLDRFFGKTPIAILVKNHENPSASQAKTIVFEVVSGNQT